MPPTLAADGRGCLPDGSEPLVREDSGEVESSDLVISARLCSV